MTGLEDEEVIDTYLDNTNYTEYGLDNETDTSYFNESLGHSYDILTTDFHGLCLCASNDTDGNTTEAYCDCMTTEFPTTSSNSTNITDIFSNVDPSIVFILSNLFSDADQSFIANLASSQSVNLSQSIQV